MSLINDNNYDEYKLLHSMRDYHVKCENADIVTNSPYYSKKERRLEALIVTGIPITMCVVVLSSFITQNYLIVFISLLVSFGVGMFAITNGFEVVRNNLINKLKRDFPDLDYDIDQNELGEGLQKYEELSKLPKNLENQKEEHLSSMEGNMRSLSTQEKIEYLKNESEFWNLVAIEEKYKENGVSEKEIPMQKKKGELCQKNQK